VFPLAEHPAMPVLRLGKQLYQIALRGSVDEMEQDSFTGLTSDGLELRVYDLDDTESL
jgi:hypothetical protein